MNSMERRIAMQKASQATPCAPSAPAGCSGFESGIWFRSACSGLWYRCKESAGDIDAWKEDGILHVIDDGPNPAVLDRTAQGDKHE